MSTNTTIEWTDATATDLAYIAGMIDGDGYITINRSVRKGRAYHYPQVGIAGTRREPHDFAASIWGGSVNAYVPRNTAHRPQFQWTRQGASAIAVIEAIAPYLRVKVDQAFLALDLWQHLCDGQGDDPFPWFSSAYDPLAVRDRMREDMVGLNQSRNRLRSHP